MDTDYTREAANSFLDIHVDYNLHPVKKNKDD